MKKYLLWFGLVIIGLGCQKNEDVVANPLDIDILGNWTWVKSSGGIMGRTDTPASSKFAQKYVFGKDLSYDLQRDGLSIDKGTYKLQHIFESPSGKLTQKITFSRTNEGFVYTLKNDTLRIDEGCCDRFVHTYTRLK
jgi:hypothetical protein